ncbi:CRTAC1 family protein, partial [bacterium]|nr:CRTAC1 family protein [bacterium]
MVYLKSHEIKSRMCKLAVLFLSLLSCLLLWSSGSLQAQITFSAVNFDEEALGQVAASWVDYDNDGDLDLLRVSAFGSEDIRLYANNGDGSFTKLQLEAFVGSARFRGTIAGGHTWGDYDNDGDLDLFVANGATDPDDNSLYQNNGDGSFTLQLDGDIVNDSGVSNSCSWGDYDNDGFLDLFVVNGGQQGEPEKNFLYRNQGDGSFHRITTGMVSNDELASWAGSWSDFDNDSDLDLFVVNGGGPNNFLYRNNGNGIFALDSRSPMFGSSGRSPSWGDYDNDGDLDLAVLARDNFLYRNNGNGTFFLVENSPIVTGPRRGPGGGYAGSCWGDFDNNGHLDLLFPVRNDTVSVILYQNEGFGSFVRASGGQIDDAGGSTLVAGDFDNDGDLDIVAGNAGVLYRNDNSYDNNWIKIQCVGTLSNRSAIGAKVRIKATVDGEQVWQLREISGQTGVNSQNSLITHFGLADASVIDTVLIEWPSRQVQLLTNVSVNQFLTVTEILAPQIEHSPSSPILELGQAIPIDADIMATELSDASLLFRAGGDTSFSSVVMVDVGNDSFRGTIPARAVTSKGVEYRLVATDIAGNVSRLPFEGTFSVRVSVPGGIVRDQEEPFGSDQTAYHLFSVPLDLQDKTPAAILEDDMGVYAPSRWRFLEYLTEEQTFRDFPEIEQLVPGKGYWFLVTEPARVIDTPGGTSFATSEPRNVLVRNGWNLIGNPFNFDIPASKITVDGEPVALRAFNGSWNNPISDPVTEIRPFDGYALFLEEFAGEVLIDPTAPVVGLAKSVHPSTPLRMRESILWSINVQARCQQARDTDNVLGVAGQASENWDPLDFPE